MKTKLLIIGTLTFALGFSACQNKTSKTEGDNTSMDMSDSTNMNMGSSMGSGMMGSMEKMMKDMQGMEMTGNVDNDFAMMMKGHHQGAVDMAQEELTSGKDETLKQMAQKIVDAQKSEISELEAFLNSHKDAAKNYDPAKKDEGFVMVMDKSMMMMEMPKMDAEDTDHQFVSMMIPHHQSAVYMAEGFIKQGKDAKLLSMAKKMIADQNKEIEEFKKWNEDHHK